MGSLQTTTIISIGWSHVLFISKMLMLLCMLFSANDDRGASFGTFSNCMMPAAGFMRHMKWLSEYVSGLSFGAFWEWLAHSNKCIEKFRFYFRKSNYQRGQNVGINVSQLTSYKIGCSWLIWSHPAWVHKNEFFSPEWLFFFFHFSFLGPYTTKWLLNIR